jgi:hypothetical protein
MQIVMKCRLNIEMLVLISVCVLFILNSERIRKDHRVGLFGSKRCSVDSIFNSLLDTVNIVFDTSQWANVSSKYANILLTLLTSMAKSIDVKKNSEFSIFVYHH